MRILVAGLLFAGVLAAQQIRSITPVSPEDVATISKLESAVDQAYKADQDFEMKLTGKAGQYNCRLTQDHKYVVCQDPPPIEIRPTPPACAYPMSGMYAQ